MLPIYALGLVLGYGAPIDVFEEAKILTGADSQLDTAETIQLRHLQHLFSMTSQVWSLERGLESVGSKNRNPTTKQTDLDPRSVNQRLGQCLMAFDVGSDATSPLGYG